MTIEAALILPLFIMAVTVFFSFFAAMAIQVRLGSAMAAVSQKMAAYYYAVSEGRGGDEETGLLAALGEDAAVGLISERMIRDAVLREAGSLGTEIFTEGGAEGISFLGSSYHEEDQTIVLRASFRLKFPYVSVFGLSLKLSQQHVQRVWSGRETEGGNDETLVYITPYGEVYHTDRNCRYIVLSIHQVSAAAVSAMHNHSGRQYEACEICARRGSGAMVYVTDYGDRYHFERLCSGLKRTVFCVPLSEVGGRPLCRKCERNGS